MDRCFRRKMRSRERGAEAVEFALVVPIFILLVFGVVDFGWMINNDTIVNNASFEGARVGTFDAVSTNITADVTNGVLAYAGTLDSSKIHTFVTCLNADGTACSSLVSASGGKVTVTVTYQHSWITPVGSTLMPSGITLTKTTQMRIE